MDLLQHIKKFKKRDCIITEKGKILSYDDVINQSELILKKIKFLKKKRLVLILADNSEEFIFAYLSFFNKNFSQILIDPKIDNKLLSNLINDYQPDFILYRSNKFKDFKNYVEIFKIRELKIAKINTSNKLTINKNLALLLSTSGSTGSTKLAKISYANVKDNTKNIVKYLNIKPNHLTITTMPPYYTYGLSLINTHLFVGGSILINNLSAFDKNFWKIIKEKKVNSFGGVPFFYEILKKLNFDRFKLPNLKYFNFGSLILLKFSFFNIS